MSQPLPNPFSEEHLDAVWGFKADPNPAADPNQGSEQTWARFIRTVGTNVPRHVNRTIRLRRRIRALGQR